MATTASRKRSATCVHCGTTLIFPARPKNFHTGETVDAWPCPACGHEFDLTGKVVTKTPSNSDRIEEFFSRFC